MDVVNTYGKQNFDGSSSTELDSPSFVATAGNFIGVILRAATDGTGDDCTVTDTAGNVYHFDGSVGSGLGLGLQAWSCFPCNGNASNVVKVTYPSQAFTAICAIQVENVPATLTLDTFTVAARSGHPDVSCTPIGHQNNQLVILASDLGTSGLPTFTPSATFTTVYSSGPSGNGPFIGSGSHSVAIQINTTKHFDGTVPITATYSDSTHEKSIFVAIYSPPNPVINPTFKDGTTSNPLTWIEHYKEDPTNSVPASANKAYAEATLNDPASYYLGLKEALVLTWAKVTRGLSDIRGQLENLAFGVTFSDTNREFRGFLDDVSSPKAGTRFLTNRPLIMRMIDDEVRRALGTPMIVANGFLSDYAPLGGLKFSFSGSDWIKRNFSRNRKSQLRWQPIVNVLDFDPNTTPPDVLNKPGPVVYGRLSDLNEQTVADSVRTTGYLPDPVSLSATVHGSPTNPISRRYYMTGLNGKYGNPNIQQWTDHRGETLGIAIDVAGAPDDAQLQSQAAAGTSPSTWVEITCSCPDAAAVRVYHGDTSGANVQGLGLADDLGSGNFSFLDGKSSTSGNASFAQGIASSQPTRNNTYIPGTLTGGNVTTDLGSGEYAPIYTGVRLCPDSVYRSEFLLNCSASKSVLSVYLGGVRLSGTEVAANFLVPNSTQWNAVWPHPLYVEFNGRRYFTIYVDRQYAKDQGLVDTNELSPGQTLLTVNMEGIETIGDGTGTLITSVVLQCQHFAENPGDRPWNAQGWVNATPFVFSAIPGLTLVNRASFADVDAAVNLTGAGVIGFQGEEVGTLDVLARFCTSGDFDIGISRFGQLIASYEPASIPAIVVTLTDVLNITTDSLTIKDDVTTGFFNVLPYRWGQIYSGRTSGGSITSRGLHLVLADNTGWMSVQNSELDVSDSQSITDYDQEIEDQQLDLFFIRDSASAAQVMNRRLKRYRNPLRTVTCTVPLSGLDIELGDIFEVSAIDGLTSSGWIGRALRCKRLELDPNTNTMAIEAYDFQRVLNAA